MTTKTIKDTDIIRIYSNEPSVSHKPRNGEIYWLWKQNGDNECFIEKTRKEIVRELRESKGLRILFNEGILVLKDKDIVEEFRLNCLDEYIKDTRQLSYFIKNCTEEEFEDYCMYAPDSMLKNIATICAKEELNDRKKIKIYKTYTGLDLEEFYQDNEESSKDENVEDKGVAKRQPRKKVNTTVTSKESK